MRKLSVIVPVYGDWQSLSKNIKALKSHVSSDSDIEVYLVNDCGPEVDTLEFKIKRAIKRRSDFHYHRNDHNLGFVKNCNNAVFNIVPQDSDILLLNSDAIITRGLIEEMQNVLYEEPNIGAVCPRSNAATIFSVPMKPEHGRKYSMRQSYGIYKKIRNQLPRRYISPLAHGFCMMIRRTVINEFGLFDEVYGKGYGEENDFCMRIVRAGWSCAVANHAYAFHYKARSFTEETRSEQVKVNEKILDARYPEYRQLISKYVESINEPSI